MTERERWNAVLTRDSRYDGRFVYAVRSTGIYCRPSCPSRRPSESKVQFFGTPKEAEGAGFRACRRCGPAGERPGAATTAAIERACRLIEANPDTRPNLAALARLAGMSAWHFQRVFRRTTGVTPRQYADARRQDILRAELKQARNVTDALYEAGYGSSSRLYEHAAEHLGMTPGAYRKGGAGADIAYATVACSLGAEAPRTRLLVAATGRGVCRIALGDSDNQLEQLLRDEFPRASLRRKDSALAGWVEAVQRSVRGEPSVHLPLDIRATAFQRRVWEELRRIPLGSTRSYGEVAARVGLPNGARAVARACASNPVAVVIPCHRVVGNDGSLTGYRWGVARKQALLSAESKRVTQPAGTSTQQAPRTQR